MPRAGVDANLPSNPNFSVLVEEPGDPLVALLLWTAHVLQVSDLMPEDSLRDHPAGSSPR